jgi:hypothetical protein
MGQMKMNERLILAIVGIAIAVLGAAFAALSILPKYSTPAQSIVIGAVSIIR